MTRLYDADYRLWALEQARLLQERRFDELDLDKLIDEVGSIAQEEIRRATRHLAAVMSNMLIAERVAGGARRRRQEARDRARRDAAAVVADSPSLLEHQPDVLQSAWGQARLDAALALDCAAGDFSLECPWSWDDLFAPEESGPWDDFFGAPGAGDFPDRDG